MTTVNRIARIARESLPEILGELQGVREEEPWLHLPEGFKLGEMPEILRLAITLALESPGDYSLCRTFLEKAAKQGEMRRKQALPSEILFQESFMVREALYHVLRRKKEAEASTLFEAMTLVERVLSLGAKASLRGYYREAFEERGEWPETIHTLAAEWGAPPRERSCEESPRSIKSP